jgi:hypothetical protein
MLCELKHFYARCSGPIVITFQRVPPVPQASTPRPSLDASKACFPVEGHLLRLVGRAGIPLRNPDLRPPLVRVEGEDTYLEMRVESGEEVGLVRRMAMDSAEVQQLMPIALEKMDWNACVHKGLAQGLAGLEGRLEERWLTSLMTFLNPRQLAILLYCARLGSHLGSGPVSFESDDLLVALGYTRTRDGGFASKVRSQVHRDLVTLHRVDLVYPRSIALGKTGTDAANRKVEVRSLLKIVDFVPERSDSGFDLFRAADLSYEMAERYTVDLTCSGAARDRILFPQRLDLSQRLGGNAKNDYRMRLLMALASRVAWGTISDGQYMIVSKQGLFNQLDLLGSNSSRNNQIFWRTIEGLKQEKFLISAQELPGKSKLNSVQFQINPEVWGTIV